MASRPPTPDTDLLSSAVPRRTAVTSSLHVRGREPQGSQRDPTALPLLGRLIERRAPGTHPLLARAAGGGPTCSQGRTFCQAVPRSHPLSLAACDPGLAHRQEHREAAGRPWAGVTLTRIRPWRVRQQLSSPGTSSPPPCPALPSPALPSPALPCPASSSGVAGPPC